MRIVGVERPKVQFLDVQKKSKNNSKNLGREELGPESICCTWKNKKYPFKIDPYINFDIDNNTLFYLDLNLYSI